MANQTTITREQLESKIQTWISSNPYLVETDNNGNVLKVRDFVDPAIQYDVSPCNLKYFTTNVQQNLVYPFNNTNFKNVPLFGIQNNTVIPLSNLPERGDILFGGFVQSKKTVIVTTNIKVAANVYIGAIADQNGVFASNLNNDYTIRYLGEDKTSSFKNSRRKAYWNCKGNWYSLFSFRNLHFDENGNYRQYYQIGGYTGFLLTGYATDIIYTKEPLTTEETHILEFLIAKKALDGDETLLNRILKPQHPYVNGVLFPNENTKITVIEGKIDIGLGMDDVELPHQTFIPPGSDLSILANDKKTENLEFSHWEVITGNVTLLNKPIQSLFIHDTQDIVVQAHYVTPEPKYTITISGEYTNSSSTPEATPGTKIIISGDSITPPYDSKIFSHWQVTSGNITLDDPNSIETFFIMPTNNVEIKAHYIEKLYTINFIDCEVEILKN